jgi:hypothetical protein
MGASLSAVLAPRSILYGRSQQTLNPADAEPLAHRSSGALDGISAVKNPSIRPMFQTSLDYGQEGLMHRRLMQARPDTLTFEAHASNARAGAAHRGAFRQ